MPIGYKHRKWQAVLTVSASGPEFSPVLERGGRFFRPRMAADLRYTTADVDYLESQFRKGNYDSGEEELHLRLRNPTREQFFRALGDIERWLGSFNGDPDWDGGGILFCFAGHGRQGDGALVLTDEAISPDEHIGSLTSIASNVSRPGRLRLSAVLDSCHSGAFATDILDSCFNKHRDLIVPFHVFASCMEDEFAWEESDLGHGLYTYCFSVSEPAAGALAATAIQPDNTFGPSLAIAGGELGCCLLSAGAQNPVVYWNGAGSLEVCGQHVNLFQDDECMSLEEMRSWLKDERDRVVDVIKPMRRDVSIGGQLSDDDMRASIQETIQFISNPGTARRSTRGDNNGDRSSWD
jgi:hypothetical protein